MKDEVWKLLGKISVRPNARKRSRRRLRMLWRQRCLNRNLFFESLRFRYFGPVDGHDDKPFGESDEMTWKETWVPKILHCLTVKEKEYETRRERSKQNGTLPIVWQNLREIVKPKTNAPQPPKYQQDVFGHTIVELAEKFKLSGLPAMPSGCSLNIMIKPCRIARSTWVSRNNMRWLFPPACYTGINSILQFYSSSCNVAMTRWHTDVAESSRCILPGSWWFSRSGWSYTSRSIWSRFFPVHPEYDCFRSDEWRRVA